MGKIQVDYDKKNYQRSAGKAIRFFLEHMETLQKNEKNEADVEKAFQDWMEDPSQTAILHVTPHNELWFAKRSVKAFALYFAQRCGVIINENQ